VFSGGEPLMRQEIIEMGSSYFRRNMVVTNGTIRIPDWPHVNFKVSVDGIEARHDRLRGAKTYQRIKRMIRDAATVTTFAERSGFIATNEKARDMMVVGEYLSYDPYGLGLRRPRRAHLHPHRRRAPAGGTLQQMVSAPASDRRDAETCR
jgi:hypothetical protein